MYIDADIAVKRMLLGKTKVYLNNRLINRAFMAKSGKNGTVAFYCNPPRVIKGEVLCKKLRGNVKVSFNLG